MLTQKISKQKQSFFVLCTLALVLIVAISSYVVLYRVPAAAAPINVLDVSIVGPDKCHVGEPTEFSAVVASSYFGGLHYAWRLENSAGEVDSRVSLVNVDSAVCTVTFLEATGTEQFLLTVEVHDDVHGFGVATKIIVDPASFPNLYIGASQADYDYKVTSDVSGTYYYSVNGSTGQVGTPLTEVSALIQSAQDALTQGGKIYVAMADEIPFASQVNITNIHIWISGPFGWHGQSSFKASAVMTNMFYVTGLGFKLENAGLDGDNKATNGVYLASGANEATLEDLQIAYFAKGLYVASEANYLENIVVDYCSNYAIDVQSNRNSFVDVKSAANVLNWRVEGDYNDLVNCWGNAATGNFGGWYVTGNYNQFSNCKGNLNDRYGWWLVGCYGNGFWGCEAIDNSQETNATYAAVAIVSNGGVHSGWNTLQFKIDSTNTTYHSYGIVEEDANQNFNLVASGTSVHNSCAFVAIKMLGANSTVSDSVLIYNLNSTGHEGDVYYRGAYHVVS